MSKLKQLRDRRAAIAREGEELVAAYRNEGRAATAEEITKLEAIASQRDDIDTQIAEAEKRADLERTFEVREEARIGGGTPRIEEDPNRGFSHFGEFCKAVQRGSRANSDRDPRLFGTGQPIRPGAAPTTYAGEDTGGDGGFLVPPGFSARLSELSLEQDALLPLCDSDPISGNTMSFPADETTPWGTTGVRAYWEGEADQATQTKPVTKLKTLRLRKLFALVPMTDELLDDAVALGSYVERKAAIDIRYKTNDAIVNGNGVGKPLGITAASSTVTQAKETSQTADTIVAANLGKMYSRVIGPQMGTWLVNPDAWHQLFLLTIGDQPVFTPPNQGITGAPGGMLMGRPVILTDTCATLGDLNDIIFGNFQGYRAITKAGGVNTATSMHLWFDYDVTAFRATFRVDGQPWLDTAVSPAKGSVTRAHFCNLAARA